MLFRSLEFREELSKSLDVIVLMPRVPCSGVSGGFFGGDRERDDDDDELLPDKDADERLLRLTGDLLLLCLGGGGIRLGGVLLRGDGRLLGLGRLLGEYDLDQDLWRLLGLV